MLQAAAQGKNVRMLVATARFPFFALVSSPKAPDINDVQHLAGKKIGVAAVGTTDQLLARYLLTKVCVDPDGVEWAVIGPNLYDVLLQGQLHELEGHTAVAGQRISIHGSQYAYGCGRNPC